MDREVANKLNNILNFDNKVDVKEEKFIISFGRKKYKNGIIEDV